MKSYIADCTIKFREDSSVKHLDDEPENEFQEEYYSVTVQANDLDEAVKQAKHKAFLCFWDELGRELETECTVNDIRRI